MNVEYYADMVFAEHFDTESWAEGENDYEAVDGIRYEIEDLYHFLKDTPNEQLSKKFQSWKRLLYSAIEGTDEI